jgi:hypothetical protein
MRIEKRKRDFVPIHGGGASEAGSYNPIIRTTTVIREVIAVIVVVCAAAGAVLLIR